MEKASDEGTVPILESKPRKAFVIRRYLGLVPVSARDRSLKACVSLCEPVKLKVMRSVSQLLCRSLHNVA